MTAAIETEAAGRTPLASVFAPAKINLALHVVGRRSDGYHLIDSLVTFVSAGDTVEALAAAGDSQALTIDGRFAPGLSAGTDNLVMRAAQSFYARFPGLPKLSLRLVKQLPLASGIGGGSADGAATLRLLAAIAGNVDPAALDDLALGLGADGPMCLHSAPLRARGIGERLENWLNAPALDLVLVNPGIAVSTPAVFRRLAQADNPPIPAVLPPCPNAATLADYLVGRTRNDLEPAAMQEAPEIAAAKAAIAQSVGCLMARMSGSGATVFGLYADPAEAGRAAASLSAAHPAWWVEVVRTIAPEQAMPRRGAENV